MNRPDEETNTITATLIPEAQRLAFVEKNLGIFFPLVIENAIYTVTEKMAKDYQGGYWNFYSLSNSGFFMCPVGDRTYFVTSANGAQGELSSRALGLVSCFTAYSHLSFSKREGVAKLCARHYYLLKDYLYSQPEPEPELEIMLKLLD